MGDILHPTRLEWDGRSGIASHDGVQVRLARAPSSQWYEVHYMPLVQSEVRERACDPRRDMTPDEIKAVQRWLEYMAHAARHALGQQEPKA